MALGKLFGFVTDRSCLIPKDKRPNIATLYRYEVFALLGFAVQSATIQRRHDWQP